MTSVFPYYVLARPDEGVRSGFAYETEPHVTLKSIAQNEPPQSETLYDKPQVDREKIRVSGPFSVEAIPPPVEELDRRPSVDAQEVHGRPEDPAGDHVSDLLLLLRKSQEVRFPDGKKLLLSNIIPLSGKGVLHAEAESRNGAISRIAISFGPRYGPVTVHQLEQAISLAQWDYKMLLLMGFGFDPEVQAFIQKNPHPRLTIQQVNINPDVLVKDLLKTPKGSQIFTVFGQPDVRVEKQNEEFVVELRGVDIYDPITGKTASSTGDKVVAWFLDSDYDGYTFRISQAFFPERATKQNPWDKLENALSGIVDPDKMEQFSRTTSLPFKLGKNKKIAVKAIDYRGNEVVVIRDLSEDR